MTWNIKLVALILIATLVAGIAWFAYSKGVQSGTSRIQTLWDAERAMQMAAHAEEQMKARQTEQALQAKINRVRTEKHREAVKLASDYAAVVNSLHNRPETRAGEGGVPTGAAAGVGCTGAGLARPDAVFLGGYARDAARLQSALNACKTALGEVTEALNGRD